MGHVVTCKDFTLGTKKSGYIRPEYRRSGLIAVGVHDGYGQKPTGLEKYKVERTSKERASIAARTGRDPGKYCSVPEFDAFDKTRASAKFVVIEIASDSSSDSGPNGGSANTEIVKAQRLHPNGRYDKNGEVIFFYWNYNGHYPFVVEDLKIVGDLKRVFV